MAYRGRKATPPARDGDTMDAYSRNWRRLLCCLGRAGVVKKTKKRYHKRTRREAKDSLRRGEMQ